MAKEQRLIDANALTDVIEHTDWYHISVNGKLAEGANPEHNIPLFKADDIYEAIENAPTVDAVEVPCKMGDEVWGLKKYRSRLIPEKGVVYQMYFGDDMRLCICVKNVCRGEWGKNVFATKEEAEAATGERREGE